jgi:hypothetical protein
MTVTRSSSGRSRHEVLSRPSLHPQAIRDALVIVASLAFIAAMSVLGLALLR